MPLTPEAREEYRAARYELLGTQVASVEADLKALKEKQAHFAPAKSSRAKKSD